MKFFSLELWRGSESDDGAWNRAVDAYHMHLETIRPRVPAALMELHMSVPLHDSRMLSFDLRGTEAYLRLRPWRNATGLTLVSLRYGGVRALRMTSDKGVGGGSPNGFGDLGYDEVDVSDGGFVHRLLWASGIELELEASSFEFEGQGG